ncbi:Trp biosynthesis-associated membrane protein [Cellulomonas gilvus]|uniref:Trp biosynthesis associated, transmembrane protein, Oprn/Chp n=1 Tax=Cellulomonas gilvus (strain ATCC 13127 / NRRL B-14078) TaxID=593907 RepID=F8A6X9_CELGA|nr:Trp biosynthesis-associated membrane protein [Cellulomonas gilvus]AEI12333.1 Trp biosynthesis associated, transmembrane protein, Oprn/Chp [Cellulomonas gilvus ATCC 13127]
MSDVPSPGSPQPAEVAAAGRARSGRGRAAGLLVLAAAATGACALPTWLSTRAGTVLGAEEAVRASGGTAAPSLVAAALVLLAATGAVALVGRFGRWVVAATVALAGALVVGAAVAVLRDPVAALLPVVTERTGVERVVGTVEVSVWPWVTVAVGVLDLLAAVWLARSSGSWATSRRHEAARGTAADGAGPDRDDERDQWDALSRGDDPT